MSEIELTSRDREYLRGLFLLGSGKKPVGPTRMGDLLNISKVSALEKMKRLETMGYGRYIDNKGLILTDKGIEIVQRDVRNHHIMERFFEEKMGMDSSEACHESSSMGTLLSANLVRNASKAISEVPRCDCGCIIDDYYEPEELMHCQWFKDNFKISEE